MNNEYENLHNEAGKLAQNSANMENTGEIKTFSQEKLDEIVQKRLREQKEKFETRQEEAIKEAIADYERKSKLSEKERQAEEEKKRQEEYDRRERELNLERSKFEGAKLLSEKGIDVRMADFLVEQDLKKTKENVELFEKIFAQAVEKGVNEQLKGKTPEDPVVNSSSTPRSGIAIL